MAYQLVSDRNALIAELKDKGMETVMAQKSGCIIAQKVSRGYVLDAVTVKDGHTEVSKEVAGTDTMWKFTRANADGSVFVNDDGTTNSWLADESVLVEKYECDPNCLENGFYRPKGIPQRFIRCDRAIRLMQPWGDDGALVAQDLPAGSWLNIQNGAEHMYGIGEHEFASTYDVIG